MGPRKVLRSRKTAPGAAKRRTWGPGAPQERPKEAAGGFKCALGGAGTPKISPRKPKISPRRPQEAQHEPKTAAGASKGLTRKQLQPSVGASRPRRISKIRRETTGPQKTREIYRSTTRPRKTREIYRRTTRLRKTREIYRGTSRPRKTREIYRWTTRQTQQTRGHTRLHQLLFSDFSFHSLARQVGATKTA